MNIDFKDIKKKSRQEVLKKTFDINLSFNTIILIDQIINYDKFEGDYESVAEVVFRNLQQKVKDAVTNRSGILSLTLVEFDVITNMVIRTLTQMNEIMDETREFRKFLDKYDDIYKDVSWEDIYESIENRPALKNPEDWK